MFWLFAALLLAICLGFIAYGPLASHRRSGEGITAPAANLAIYQDKLVELQGQLDRGIIDEAQFHELELEAQRQLLAESGNNTGGIATHRGGRWLVVALSAAVPALAIFLYTQLGAERELPVAGLLSQRQELLAENPGDAESLEQLDSRLLTALQRAAEANPERLVYRVTLARLHLERGELPEALAAYRRVLEQVPGEAALIAEYAQTLYFAEGGKMTPEVEAAVDRALALSPDNDTALGLKGIASYEAGEYAAAVDYWNRALAGLPPQSESARALRSGIQMAGKHLGDAAPSPQAEPLLEVRISVPADAAAQLAPDTPVFVFAREWQGPPMPILAQRLKLSDLPAKLTLDDSLALNPQRTLSSVGRFEVVARVSVGGTPQAAPGDLEGRSGPLSLAEISDPLVLVINSKLP